MEEGMLGRFGYFVHVVLKEVKDEENR